MGQSGLSSMMSPQGVMGMANTMSDPQQMLGGLIGPSRAGIKPPPQKPAELKKPSTSALGAPKSYADLLQLSVPTTGGGGAGIDPETLRMLQMLAGRGA